MWTVQGGNGLERVLPQVCLTEIGWGANSLTSVTDSVPSRLNGRTQIAQSIPLNQWTLFVC